MALRIRDRTTAKKFNDTPNGHVKNGAAIPSFRGHDKTAAVRPPKKQSASPHPIGVRDNVAADEDKSSRIRRYLKNRQLDAANAAVLEILDRRIERGDTALDAVRGLLHHYIEIVANMAPMAHLGCAPLRPDDRLVQVFVQVVDLMHKQNQQLHELQAIAAELV